jgi:Leucine-rich repeat (LRR) protein
MELERDSRKSGATSLERLVLYGFCLLLVSLAGACQSKKQSPPALRFCGQSLDANLREIHCKNSLIEDFSALEHLPDLKSVSFSNCQISDISKLAEVASLESLYIFLSSDRYGFRGIGKLQGLTALKLIRNRMAALPSLADLRHLRRLNIVQSQLENLDGLVGAHSIRNLMLDAVDVVSVDVLARMEKLEFLSLRNMPVTDVTPLSGLPKLKTFMAAGLDLKSLRPLLGMKRIEFLFVAENRRPLLDEEIAALKAAYPPEVVNIPDPSIPVPEHSNPIPKWPTEPPPAPK